SRTLPEWTRCNRRGSRPSPFPLSCGLGPMLRNCGDLARLPRRRAATTRTVTGATPDKLRAMYKRLGIAMLGLAAAATIGACSPAHEQPSPQDPGAGKLPTTLQHPPEPVTLGKGDSGNNDSSGAADTCDAEDIQVEGSFGSAPTVTLQQDCGAPTELQKRDLKSGTGQRVEADSDLMVRYQAVAWSDGEVLQGNFDTGGTLAVDNVGETNVFDGWSKGLVGMKEGGRRLLVVPPQQRGGSAAANKLADQETAIVFVVDAVSVNR